MSQSEAGHAGTAVSVAGDRAQATTEYTLAHISRLDLLIRREVLRFRLRRSQPGDDEFRGLYISEDDVDDMLRSALGDAGLLTPAALSGEEATAFDAALASADSRIAQLEDDARERGEMLRLDQVARLFGLSPIERQVLVVALAAELDLKYERLFAYLQDDVTKRRPAVDLVLRLLCPTLAERLAARAMFDVDAPLLRWELIALQEDPPARHAVLLSRQVKLDDRIAAYLLGVEAIDSNLASLVAELPVPGGAPAAVRERLQQWAQQWAAVKDAEPLFLFHGRYGTGRRAAAAFLAARLGRACLLLDLSGLPSGEQVLGRILKLADREALLRGALLCLYHVDHLLRPDPVREAEQRAFARALARGCAAAVLIGEQEWEPAHGLDRREFVRLEMPETTYAERRARWTTGLADVAGFDEREISALAGRFRLTPGQIADAVDRASTLAWMRDPVRGHMAPEDITAACRSQSQHRLDALARKLTPRYGWNDIVLRNQELSSLRLITSMIRQRAVVYGEWGFDRKLAMGKGVIALFAGPSGTGKTMAAEIIANDLGLDLYKIDLSAVVNKYVGETEKNLERLFAEARNSDAILFFDEADALFGKRSGVSDAHDRYANIETAYLLQRTEEYDGLVILASNLPKNVDDAFLRRLHFSISFPEPDEPERFEIWQRTFPREAPLAPDVDLASLARKFKLNGGNIRNIILAAAFLAADEQQSIAQRHLLTATGHELQKLGKMRHERDFGTEARHVGT